MRRSTALASSTLLVLLACGSQDGPPVPYALGARAILPFPTDALTAPELGHPTRLRLAFGPPGTNLRDADEAIFLLGPEFAAPLERLDGWSTLAPAFIPLDQPPDRGTLEHAVLVDLEARRVVPVVRSVVRGPTRSGRETTWIALRPSFPLRPATRHALVLLRGLEDEGGLRFTRAPTFAALLAGDRVDGDPARVAAARARLVGLMERLEDAGLRGDDVLVADTFTTQSVFEENDALVRAFQAGPRPDVEVVAVDGAGPLGERAASDALWGVARFRVRLPRFRSSLTGRLAVTPDGAMRQGEEIVEGLISLPQGAGPFRVIVYQHGLGDRKESMRDFAEALARRGMAVAAFDAPLHGARTDHPERAGAAFLDILEVAQLADNFRQAATEHAYWTRVVDVLAELDLYGDGGRRLDTSRLFYLGMSLGSIIGGAAIGLEPRYEGAALVVGGGTLLEFVENALRGFALDAFPGKMFVSVAQTVIDRGDPSNFAVRSADKQVLLLQAMEDEIIPAGSTAALGRAMRLPQLQPVHTTDPDVEQIEGPREGRGWTQFSPAQHQFAVQPESETYARGRAQLFRFLETWAATGRGTIE